MNFKEAKNYSEIIESLLYKNHTNKRYFHYTSLKNYENMLLSGKIELTRGDSNRLNDWLEKFKCADESIWKRIYIACFTYERDESIALWQSYGNPLSQAIRLEIDSNIISRICGNNKQNIYKVNLYNSFNDRYELLNNPEFESINFTGVSYWEYRGKEPFLFFNNTKIKSSDAFFLNGAYAEETMVGRLKNIAWKHEKEFRILAFLPQGLDDYPEKIAIDALDLWKRPKQIFCSPCLDKNVISSIYSNCKIVESEMKHWVNLEKECVYCRHQNMSCKKNDELTIN